MLNADVGTFFLLRFLFLAYWITKFGANNATLLSEIFDFERWFLHVHSCLASFLRRFLFFAIPVQLQSLSIPIPIDAPTIDGMRDGHVCSLWHVVMRMPTDPVPAKGCDAHVKLTRSMLRPRENR